MKNVIDCHYHYYPEEFNVSEKIEKMDCIGLSKIALIAPVAPDFPAEPKSFIMRFMRFLMDKPLLYPIFRKLMCTFEDNGINILGDYVPISFIPQNKPVFDAAEQNSDRLLAYITLNPDRQSEEEMQLEINRYSSSPSFCGFKAHPFYHQYPISKLDKLCKLIAPYEKPLLIHMCFDSKEEMISLAKKYPNQKFILAHCAFPHYTQIWKKIRPMKNVYLDISSGSYVDSKMARKAISYFGPDRILYGTDGPYGHKSASGKFDMQWELEFVTKGINASDLKLIAHDNFRNMI